MPASSCLDSEVCICESIFSQIHESVDLSRLIAAPLKVSEISDLVHHSQLRVGLKVFEHKPGDLTPFEQLLVAKFSLRFTS